MRLKMDGVLTGRITCVIFVFAIATSIQDRADSSLTAKRDSATQKINVCLQSKNASSHLCKHLNENVETLVGLYRGGDRSVLLTLLRFTYLTDVFDDALLSDPDGFLAAMAKLPEKDQRAVAQGLAGGMFRLRSRDRFEALRTMLTSIPVSSPVRQIAQTCLRSLEATNAVFLVTYFPPDTFTDGAADFTIAWFSRDMYALGEKPLWPPSSNIETTYRFTKLGAFSGPEVVTLTVQPDGSGRFNTRVINANRDATLLDDNLTASPAQLAKFFSRLDQANFWNTPTQLSTSGRDGAEWILEGVQNGKYRVVVRWSPDIERKSAEEVAFADAAGLMFELAGHKQYGQ